MCGRFTLTTTPEEVARHFDLDEIPLLAPRYNAAPGQEIASISLAAEGSRRVLALRRWGLIPAWAKDPKIGHRMINARFETAAEKPSFRSAFRKRRCLIPADGFYEWAARTGAARQPFHIALPGRPCFAIAGLWESWRDPQGAPLETCTLLTTSANATLRAVHDRMPVILDPADYAAWLDPKLADAASLASLVRGAPAEALELHPVGRRVNDPRFDDAACLEPASGPG
ncbi:MAG TPA: SOS response-associated peptidase [Myxococcota bacterium]|jgi:putative SOS response-associated peptidase YedK